MAGYKLHKALFQKGAYCFSLSKGEDEASEGLDYSRFIHTGLPDFLRLSFGKDQSSLLTFPLMDSKIRALPSTEDAGVGFGGATLVDMDEFEYHKYADKNYSEIISAAERGGQVVILSTADKERVNTKFKELYRQAKVGGNNFFPIFFPYDVLPDRDQKWYDSLDLSPSQKECRFPRNEEEALETLKTRKAFDMTALEGMITLSPIELPEFSRWRGIVKIYKPSQVGRKYCIFTDPSMGVDDPHATVVRDHNTGEWVAISHGKVTADQCAEIHDALVRYYNDAWNSYELNARAGGHFESKIKQLDTPNRCPRVTPEGKLDRNKFGWWTGSGLRNKIYLGLEENIRMRQEQIYDSVAISELKDYIIPEGENPRAPGGGHDDFIIAGGGVIQIDKYVPAGIKVASWKFRG